MFSLIALHIIIAVTLVTSAMGATCILRKLKIVDLHTKGRNFMIVGALCAMPFGFIAASVCANTLVATPLHYLAAIILCLIGLFATAHIYLDLFDRIRILKPS